MKQMLNFAGRTIALAGLLAATACGVEETKAKISTDEGGIAFDESISLAGSGNFSEVSVVNTPHPYANSYSRRWEVAGSADAIEMKISFTRFELENGYDFITITDAVGGQRTQHTGNKSGTDVIVSGNRVIISMNTDTSITGWGARLEVSERLPCRCAEINDPVCGADGVTYANSCAATCENVGVSHRGACSSTWTGAHTLIESAHPYADKFSNVWTISEAGATRIRAHFSRIDVERGYDYVTILDANDNVIARYTGVQENVTTPEVAGGTLKVQLTTDDTVTRFGFILDNYEVQGGCTADADCGAGMGCAQITCIRAPCFNVCYPLEGNYTTASVTDLNREPARFNGMRVRVVSEPILNTAACTRIGCTASNPCCNQCVANFRIEGDIYLEGMTPGTFGCSGNSCNWQDSCTPFTGGNAGPYELDGVFSVDEFNTKRLTVDNYRASNCTRQGCGSHLCANTTVFSTCNLRPEDACYASAECVAQGDGHCGFTQTETLSSCIATHTAPQPITIASSGTAVRIPDNSEVGVTSSIVVPRQTSLSRVRVSVDITHTYRGDLHVVVVAPNGTETVLHNRTGGSYDNLALRDVTINNVDASSAAGTWRLIVRDRDASDTGTLDRWSITLN